VKNNLMTKFTRNITTAIATGAVLLNALAPLAYAETLLITGNGAGSDNVVAVTNNSTTTVTQTNTAKVSNIVDTKADTGGNSANFNTGGSVTVDTGKAAVTTTVTNTLNSNSATVDCCGATQPTEVKIDGNGAFSDNTAVLNKSSDITVSQNNSADVKNTVKTDASTGDNQAGFNTGSTSGTDGVTVKTGAAKVSTTVGTEANANMARVSPAGDPSGSGTSLTIKGNGAGSDNLISVVLPSSIVLAQDNSAHVSNFVETKAETGENDANFNTGSGDVTIDTGKADVTTTVDNMLNFNAAEVDCGCVLSGGITAKIAGNGAEGTFGYDKGSLTDPENTISAVLGSTQSVRQGNGAYLNNMVDGRDNGAYTGDNEASKNTGDPSGDPSVMTGNSAVTTSVSNTSNSNVLGSWDLPEFQLPEFQTQFDFSAMLSFFGLFLS